MAQKLIVSSEPQVISLLKAKGYKVFSRTGELNIVGVRAPESLSNTFDDQLHVFFRRPEGGWNYYIYPCTTDPGTYWLKNPAVPAGTAMLSQGQYLKAYQIGLHKGKYKALVQARPVKVKRLHSRDALLLEGGKEETGLFGINIHRAGVQGKTLLVDKYSAGCTVLAEAKDFTEFMRLCDMHAQLYGNEFTYSLVDMREIARDGRIQVGIGAMLAAGLLAFWEILFNSPGKSEKPKRTRTKKKLQKS